MASPWVEDFTTATQTSPSPNQVQMVNRKWFARALAKVATTSDDDEWSDAYTAAHAYIDASLPPLA
jgi:hypothetical protein